MLFRSGVHTDRAAVADHEAFLAALDDAIADTLSITESAGEGSTVTEPGAATGSTS